MLYFDILISEQVPVLKNLNVSVHPNEVVAIVSKCFFFLICAIPSLTAINIKQSYILLLVRLVLVVVGKALS